MKREDIVKSYPELFKEGFVITSGNGWDELVKLTCEYFKMLLQEKRVDDIKFDQIKETLPVQIQKFLLFLDELGEGK